MINKNFDKFNLDTRIVSALKKMGFSEPTEVQNKVIPKALEGNDLIVLSKTGSGKTAAFGIPIINNLIKGGRKLRALILAPTRELALQVEDDIKKISSETKIITSCVYGRHSMNEEVLQLDKGVDIVCGTPGRVFDHLQNGTIDASSIDYFVLDEADRMLAMGFIEQIESILKYVPKERKTYLFSATMPFEIMNITWQYMREPVEIRIESETKTVDRIKQLYYLVDPNQKRTALYKLIALYKPESLLVFCNTRWQVDRIVSFLSEKGFSAKGIHGGQSQSGRTKTMGSFKEGFNKILVATDVAARGIHVEDLEMVINFDVPNEKDNYVHRIGRTGRIGNSGIAVTLATSEDMYSLYEIEEHVGAMISMAEFPSDEKMKEIFKEAKALYSLKNKQKSRVSNEHGKTKVFDRKKTKKPLRKHVVKEIKKDFKEKKKELKTDDGNYVFVFNGKKQPDIKNNISFEKNNIKSSKKEIPEKLKQAENVTKKKLTFWQRIFGKRKK